VDFYGNVRAMKPHAFIAMPFGTKPDTEGKPITLSKLLERGPVILAFFPKAFTAG